MNREIKFKVWDIEEKEMYEPHKIEYINFYDGFVTLKVVGFIEFEDAELLQYTGLKDKNGKEIYEGDIIKRESMAPGGLDRIGKITIEDGVIWIESNVDSVCLFDEIDELEVIGNIYENPELLEEK